MRLHFRAIAFLLALVAAPQVAAQEQPDVVTRQARQRFAEGVKAASARDYETAIAAFKQAYALKPTPDVLRNLGVAEVRGAEYKSGARHLAEYLRWKPTIPPDQLRAVRDELAKAERHVGRLVIRANVDDATITVDGEALGAWSNGEPWHVDPGEHVVAATKPGFQLEKRSIGVDAGQVTTVSLELKTEGNEQQVAAGAGATAGLGRPATTRSDADNAPAAPSSESRSIVPMAVGGGVTVAALVAGIVFHSQASSNEDDARELARALPSRSTCANPQTTTFDCAALGDAFDSANRKYDMAKASFVIAGVAGAATLALAAHYFFWPQEPVAKDNAIRPYANVSLTSGHVGVSGNF